MLCNINEKGSRECYYNTKVICWVFVTLFQIIDLILRMNQTVSVLENPPINITVFFFIVRSYIPRILAELSFVITVKHFVKELEINKETPL